MFGIVRTEESRLTSWLFEVDRPLLLCVLLMMLLSLVFSVSAGSVAAERINQPWFFFLVKALPFYGLGLGALFFASFLSKKWVLKLAGLNLLIGLAMLPITVLAPHVINGSARFVSLGAFNVMPADIMKPGFVIMTAFFLSKMKEKYGENIFTNKDAWRFDTWLSWCYYLLIFIPVLLVIFKHPDFGTSVLYFAVWGAMLFVAGLPLFCVPLFGVLAAVMLTVAFVTLPHVHRRFMTFFTGEGEAMQVNKSVDTLRNGGLLGAGDDSFVKQGLPDSHTDFIFAVIVEDLGALGGCALLFVLLYVIKRLITSATKAKDLFVLYAVGGGAALFGAQVCINMLTTLGIIPPKGMTLPFISYGGSSLLSYCVLFGFILALIREDKWKKMGD
ncbi:MAG: FtsW/RodA/SpoVE family cell cycle protein [Alphaproteobacteria bacterium]|nr:FtsW/RodA/SpoVE family cell cycle protein [Alphaproteobacteria bacterium]